MVLVRGQSLSLNAADLVCHPTRAAARLEMGMLCGVDLTPIVQAIAGPRLAFTASTIVVAVRTLDPIAGSQNEPKRDPSAITLTNARIAPTMPTMTMSR